MNAKTKSEKQAIAVILKRIIVYSGSILRDKTQEYRFRLYKVPGSNMELMQWNYNLIDNENHKSKKI